MEHLGDFAALLTALGVGTILRGLIDRLLDRRRGRIADAQEAWARYDDEATFRRRLQEALDETRRAFHRATGTPYSEMPAVPTRPPRSRD